MALSRPASKTNIANLALAVIGESPISNIDSTTDPAAINAKAVIDQAILEVQADYPWQELKTVVKLSADDDFEQAGEPYAYRFTLPDDFVRPCKDVNDQVVTDTSGNAVRHYFMGGTLYAAGTPVHLNYIRESDNPAEWWPWLTSAVYHRLAILLAPARNKSATLVDRLIQIFEQIVRKRMRHQSGKYSGANRMRRGGNSYDEAGRGYF